MRHLVFAATILAIPAQAHAQLGSTWSEIARDPKGGIWYAGEARQEGATGSYTVWVKLDLSHDDTTPLREQVFQFSVECMKWQSRIMQVVDYLPSGEVSRRKSYTDTASPLTAPVPGSTGDRVVYFTCGRGW
jgi:hypothetical protein